MNGHVYVDKIVYDNLISIAKTSIYEESGIFLGYYLDNSYFITDYVVDKTQTNKSSTSAIRRTAGIYDEYLLKTVGKKPVDYMGEWHTHPAGVNNLSSLDIIAGKSILGSPDYGRPKQIFVGVFPKSYRPLIYLFTRNTHELMYIEVMHSNERNFNDKID